MSEFDPKQMESDLQALKPAQAPPEILDRILLQLARRPESIAKTVPKHSWPFSWRKLALWWIPATAAGVAAAILFGLPGYRWSIKSQAPHAKIYSSALSADPAVPKEEVLRADKVEIERQLVANFDAIGKLSTGEPVRFRCEQWLDKVQLRDSAAGMVIERTVPRLEIVPIRFETY